MSSPFKDSNRQLITLKSNADLSANQYKAVRLFASLTCGIPATVATSVIGIQENKPSSVTGEEIRVCVSGATIATAGEAFTAGSRLVPNGTSNTATANLYRAATMTSVGVVGIALESATLAGELITVLVSPSGNVI